MNDLEATRDWKAQLVAEAFCRSDGNDPKALVHCGGCGLNHQFWERYLTEAKRFIAAFEALMSVQKENLQ